MSPLLEVDRAVWRGSAEAVSQQVVAKEDFAFVVPASVTAGALVAVVREAGGDLVEDARVFDV